MTGLEASVRHWRDRLRLALVTGAGLGLAPVAPGTFGTLGGLGLAVLLQNVLSPQALPWGLAVVAAALSWAGAASTDLVRRAFASEDPGAFVLDEIVGYLVTVLPVAALVGPPSATTHVVAFAAFRVFDVVKPFPVGRLERLPGAWGIMADDLMAGVYAGGLTVLWGVWAPW